MAVSGDLDYVTPHTFAENDLEAPKEAFEIDGHCFDFAKVRKVQYLACEAAFC